MNFFTRILRTIYTAWAIGTYIVFMTIGAAFIVVVHSIFNENKAHRMVIGYCRWWATVWTFMCGIKIKVIDNPKIKTEESYVFVTNHCSNLDAMIWAYSPRNISKGLAKKELMKIPFLGYIFSKVCVIVDRSDKESRKKSIGALIEEMKKGVSLMIFPEGTRNKTDKPLQPFHSGAFRIAVEVQKPIVPVVFCNAGLLMPIGNSLYKPGTVKCIFLDPIPTEGLTEADIDRIKDESFQRMEKAVLENDDRFRK